jgi:putative nucleotidyltransferase with HDIG domain
MRSNFSYRIWQFRQSLKKPPGQEEWNQIKAILSPAELALFQKLPVPDQNHSLRVLRDLEADEQTDHELLKAALLHDIGKTRYPLRRWERVFAVLLEGFFPKTAAAWGRKDPQGIYRPLVIIHQHPLWGADLAHEAGSSERVIWLIRHHEAQDLGGLLDHEGVELLKTLQKADNIS